MQICARLIVVMFKNQNTTMTLPQNLLMTALSYGMLLSSMHGAYTGGHGSLAPSDFRTQVIREMHTHSDIQIQANRVILDPRSLRSIRSEDDKLAETDGLRGNWDVYRS